MRLQKRPKLTQILRLRRMHTMMVSIDYLYQKVSDADFKEYVQFSSSEDS